MEYDIIININELLYDNQIIITIRMRQSISYIFHNLSAIANKYY